MNMLRLQNWFVYLGVMASVVTMLSWVMFVLTEPYGHDEAEWIGFLIIAAMFGFSFLAAWSSITKRIFWLCVAFLISFFPVGLYMLLTPGMGKWIGIGNLVYLVSAIGMYCSTDKEK